MSKPKVRFVHSDRLSVDLFPICSVMTVGAEGDEVVVFVGPTLCLGDDVMHVNPNIATGRDRASMPGLNKDAPTYVSGYMGPRTAQLIDPTLFDSL